MPKTTSEHIEEIAEKYKQEFVTSKANEFSVIHHERLRATIHSALMELYEMKFPGCRACGDEGFHSARALVIAEIIKDFKRVSGDLFANFQDNEASYIRANIIAPLIQRQKEEQNFTEHFSSGFHDCTLTGLHP